MAGSSLGTLAQYANVPIHSRPTGLAGQNPSQIAAVDDRYVHYWPTTLAQPSGLHSMQSPALCKLLLGRTLTKHKDHTPKLDLQLRMV